MSAATPSARPFAALRGAGLRRYLQGHPIVVLSLLFYLLRRFF